jgi:hypothetical protein
MAKRMERQAIKSSAIRMEVWTRPYLASQKFVANHISTSMLSTPVQRMREKWHIHDSPR